METPEFVYFDLGNVLLKFDHALAAEQMASVAACSPEAAWKAVFETDLEHQYEAGQISSQDFYEAFCRQTDSRPNQQDLLRAASDIFSINLSMIPLVAHLRSAGYRLGILSNTNEAHWNFVSDGRYRFIRDFFEFAILSFEVQSMKPEPRIYEAAAERAQVEPGKIFFMDDREENVAGAVQAGLDAVHYTSTGRLLTEFLKRGFEFNY